jgi:hypothetical protein
VEAGGRRPEVGSRQGPTVEAAGPTERGRSEELEEELEDEAQ